MLKILQINKLFHPWIGGVETVVKQLADGLYSDSGFEVAVLAGNENKSDKTVIDSGLGYKVFKTSSMGMKFSTPISLSYFRNFKRLRNEYDIFHFHVPNPLGELAHFLFSIPEGKKVVITFHADVKKTRWRFFYIPYSILLKKLFKRADVIISTAPNNLANTPILEKYKHKCKIIPLGYDARDCAPVNDNEKLSFKKRFNLNGVQNNLLFVGRLSYYKGVEILLQAIKNLDVKLVIAGEGGLRSRLEELSQQLGIENKVVFAGILKRKDLIAAYSLADIFVLPSISEAEAFGLVQLEAMHFGVPVINTNLPTGVPFVSIDGVTGLTVTPTSVVELEKAIKTLLDNTQLRSKLGANAKARAARFSTKAMVEAYKTIYLSQK